MTSKRKPKPKTQRVFNHKHGDIVLDSKGKRYRVLLDKDSFDQFNPKHGWIKIPVEALND